MIRVNLIILLLIIVSFTGCATPPVKPKKICPGKQSVAEALQSLSSRVEQIKSFKANGQCFARFYDDNGKRKKEEFTIKLWLNPQSEIRLFGDIAFNARGLDIGSNKDEFWIGAKPKEIGNSFYWGKWDQQENDAKVLINPKVLLEAVGLSGIDCSKTWSLSREGGFDILTKRTGSVESRKVYIDTCDYLVRRIEYFNKGGQKVLAAELDRYKEVVEGFSFPRFIRIVNGGSKSEDSVEITFNLKPAKKTSFNEKQQAVLFGRPEPRGFEHVYRIVGGKRLEQTE